MDSKTSKCGFQKLPGSLIVYISRILLGTNNDKINRKQMLPLVYSFKECRKYYVGESGVFRLCHWLWVYSEKYYDVMLLARQYGLNRNVLLLSKSVEYIVVNVNDERFQETAGYITHPSEVRHPSLFGFIPEGRYVIADFKVANLDAISNTLRFHIDMDDDIHRIRWWDKVLFADSTFPMMHKKDIMLHRHDNYIDLSGSLTLEKFKELINKKEGKEIFSINT